jgi:hypothetical protein
LLICSFSQAQIKLKDDSVHPSPVIQKSPNNTLPPDTLKEIIGYGMYTATIVGYANFCQFPRADEKLVFDNYFSQIYRLSLPNDQIRLISEKFTETAQQAKKLGVSNSKITCSQFKQDFDKIIIKIKSQ